MINFDSEVRLSFDVSIEKDITTRISLLDMSISF